MQRDNPRRSQRKRSSYKVEHLPAHSHLPASTCRKATRFGVLVCEAFRERSEQRANKHPEVGGWRSQRKRSSYGWLRTLRNHAVNGSHSSQSGQARYSGSSKIPRPRV